MIMKLEERRSSSYWKRQELMKECKMPTISEIKDNVGDILAEVIFEEANEVQKEYLGLNSPLKGLVGEIWTSPSDILLGKVCLKPPFTQKHIQALTHQGIMEIGARIEEKYWNEMELEKKRAVEEEGVRLHRIFEIEKRQLLTKLEQDLKAKHREQIEMMKLLFENRINQLITECYNQISQLEEEEEVAINSLNVLWQEKLEETVQLTVKQLTEEFLEKIRLQEQVLLDIFNKQANNLKAKYRCALDLEKVKCKEITLQLRHNLECQNIANLMYVLCKERRKCKGEKQALEQYYLEQIRQNKRQIRIQARAIRRLTIAKNRRQKQLATRERIVIAILRQFLKFIYYALKASPTQGEFLLNINKLIKFEVEDYCAERKKEVKRAVKAKKAVEPPDVIEYLEIQSEELPEEEEEFQESDVLPAFIFDEKMYVREDFRDMFSAGIKIDRHHPLWNQDVEELLHIFKESMTDKRSNFNCSSSGKIKSQQSSVHFIKENIDGEEIFKPGQNTEVVSEKISVGVNCFSLSQRNSAPSSEEIMEKEIRKVSLVEYPDIKDLSDEDKTDKKAKKLKNGKEVLIAGKSSTEGTPAKTDPEDIRPKLKDYTQTQSKIALARDSVILHISTMEKKSLMAVVEKSSPKSAKEDDDKKSTISPIDEELQQAFYLEGSEDVEGSYDDVRSATSLTKKIGPLNAHTSKLVLAQDSLEMLRSTIAITEKSKGSSKESSVKDKKSLPTFSDEVHVFKNAEMKRKVAKSGKRKTTKSPHKKSAPKHKQPTAKVVGTLKSKEYEKATEVFTEERITSLVNLMKDNPSLIRLFTACSQ